MKTTITSEVRWMVRRDMPEVLHIDDACYFEAWKEEDFLSCLRRRDVIGMVAEVGEKVVGFMIYEFNKTKLVLLNMAVDPEYHRCGVGTTMVKKLISKLSANRRTSIRVNTRETNLGAQLFFKSQGFRAVNILRNYYDNDEDAYHFRYEL